MHKLIIKLNICLLFCIILSPSEVSQAKIYNTDYHFSLSVPAPFIPISQERIKLIESGKNELTGTNNVKLVLVFLIHDKDYPNIQVSFEPHPEFENASFEQIINAYKDLLVSPETIQLAKKKLGPVMRIVKIAPGKQLVNYNKKMLLYVMKADAKMYGSLVKVSGIFILKKSTITVDFVCKEIEIEKYSSIIHNLFESVSIEKNYIHD